jgi:hypothetical protein
MWKLKSGSSCRLCHRVGDFNGVFTSDGEVLLCRLCGKSIVAELRSQVTRSSQVMIVPPSATWAPVFAIRGKAYVPADFMHILLQIIAKLGISF